MQPKDYYKTLGVPETVSSADLKKAYRKIAQESHPDRNPGDAAAEERFKEASEAYDVLSNAEKRKKYDALRKYGFGEAGFGPGGFRPDMGGFPGGFRVHVNQGDFQEMDFADIFAEGSPFAGLFEHIFQQMGAGGPAGARRGPAFGGRQGPFPGMGPRPGAGPGSGPGPRQGSGDAFFRPDGLDVHCTVWLRLEQLEKGAKVKVRTPSGKKALVRVPPKSRIGGVLRLPGLGLSDGTRRGDQYVHLEAVA